MQKPKIFVIDDDLDIQELILNYFRPRGYVMKGFADAEEALWELESQPDACDVLITDLKLPKMSGFDLIRSMKERGLKIPIILMTGHRSSESAIQAIQEGAYDFVVKPLHFPQLMVSIERAVHLTKIREENSTLRAAVNAREGITTEGIIGKSPGLLRVIDLAKRVADSSANIFISGESGTGKEVIARAIHQYSNRKKEPFIAINCSAIPENLLESELFGYVKGAFTGAMDKKLGLFEEAEGGTLFLDEIGDMSLVLQAKLLRVLQERKIKRLGENQPRKIDVRIISATHKNLKKEIGEKTFREDLYFRIAVIPIHLQPLRERREDVLPLAEFFLKKYSLLNGASITGFAKEATEYLLRNTWPGNVRELENSVERAVVLRNKGQIELEDINFDYNNPMIPMTSTVAEPAIFSSGNSYQTADNYSGSGLGATSGMNSNDAPSAMAGSYVPAMPTSNGSASNGSSSSQNDQVAFYDDVFDANKPLMSLQELTEHYIIHALKKNGGAKDRTAKVLGIDRKTLYRKIQDFEARGLIATN
jgi:two-component system response regulator HydG